MHLRHRPQSLDELIGLDHIKKALKDFKFDVPIMFLGERGTGKSTLAGIVARQFADNEELITTLNCGYFSQVKDMREEIDKLNKTSIFGKKRVIILDELHSLKVSEPSQKAWLLPLENLPSNVMVIACTTTTEKLLNMFVERFVQYRTSKMNKTESKQLISEICKKESIVIPKWIKSKIVDKTDGIPRLILTALPKLVNVETEEEVDRLLETAKMSENNEALDILKHLISNMPWQAVVKILQTALKTNTPETLRVSMMNQISGRMISQYSSGVSEVGKLSKMFEYLREGDNFPEKANLINAVFNCFQANGGSK